jgi:hypothetical protein
VADRLAPVVDHPQRGSIGRAGRARAIGDLLVDRARVLEPWVLIGDDHEVGELGGGAPHRRPLGRVALPRRAEDDDEPAGRQRSKDVEHLAQRVLGMRVVDDDGEGLAGLHPRHPARHARRRSQRERSVMDVQAERLDHAEGRERVQHVEPARHPDPHPPVPARRLEVEGRAGRIGTQVAGPQIGLRVDPVGDDPVAGPIPEVGERRVVGVQDRDRGLLHQPRLRRTICLERAVELEVLARQVGHHADREAAVPRPLQRQPVRGRLHHHAVVAGLDHAGEERLELERLGRGAAVEVRLELVEDAGEDGADLPGVPAAGPQHLRGKGGDRRLAVGAGHTDDGEPLGRAAIPGVGGIGQGTTRPVDHQLRDRCVGELPLHHQADGTALDGLRGEVVPVDVHAGNGEEERARLHLPRVVGKRADLADRDADHPVRRDHVGQRTEAHAALGAHRGTGRRVRRARSQPRMMPVAWRSR